MVIEAKFKHTLKEMMKEKDIEDINVTTLCERCSCHRQTFYYHYQDIYDLIAAIFLGEKLEKFETSKTIRDALRAFVAYAKDNYDFLRKTYNSAAKDLVDDFMVSKLNLKILQLQKGAEDNTLEKKNLYNFSRRLAKVFADEFGHYLKENGLPAERFAKKAQRYIDDVIATLLPSYVSLSMKEATRND